MAAGEASRRTQVQEKLVEVMKIHQRKGKMSAAMTMCREQVKEREAKKKCGTPGAGEEQQVEEEKQMVVNKLKHIVNSQKFANWYEPTNEFRLEKKGDVIRAREPKVP